MIGSFLGDQLSAPVNFDQHGWNNALVKHEKLHDSIFQKLSSRTQNILLRFDHLLGREGSEFSFRFFRSMMSSFRDLMQRFISLTECEVACFKNFDTLLNLLLGNLGGDRKYLDVAQKMKPLLAKSEFRDVQEDIKKMRLTEQAFCSPLSIEKVIKHLDIYLKKIKDFLSHVFEKFNVPNKLSDDQVRCAILLKKNYSDLVDKTSFTSDFSCNKNAQSWLNHMVRNYCTILEKFENCKQCITAINQLTSNNGTIKLCGEAVHFKKSYANLYEGISNALGENTQCKLLANVTYFEDKLPQSIFVLDCLLESNDAQKVKVIWETLRFFKDFSEKTDVTFNGFLGVNLDVIRTKVAVKKAILRQCTRLVNLCKQDKFLYTIIGKLVVIHNLFEQHNDQLGCESRGAYNILPNIWQYFSDDCNADLPFYDYYNIDIEFIVGTPCTRFLIDHYLEKYDEAYADSLRVARAVSCTSAQKNSNKSEKQMDVQKQQEQKQEKPEQRQQTKSSRGRGNKRNRRNSRQKEHVQEEVLINPKKSEKPLEELVKKPYGNVQIKKDNEQIDKNIRVQLAKSILQSLLTPDRVEFENDICCVIRQLYQDDLQHKNSFMNVVLYKFDGQPCCINDCISLIPKHLKYDKFHQISPLVKNYLKYGYMLDDTMLNTPGIHQQFCHQLSLKNSHWALIIEARIIHNSYYDCSSALNDREQNICGHHHGAYVFIFDKESNECIHACFHQTQESKACNAYREYTA